MPFGCRGNCADDSAVEKGWGWGAEAAWDKMIMPWETQRGRQKKREMLVMCELNKGPQCNLKTLFENLHRLPRKDMLHIMPVNINFHYIKKVNILQNVSYVLPRQKENKFETTWTSVNGLLVKFIENPVNNFTWYSESRECKELHIGPLGDGRPIQSESQPDYDWAGQTR